MIDSTDRLGKYLDFHPQHSANMATTIYQAIGTPKTVDSKDEFGRSHEIYFGDPINSLIEE